MKLELRITNYELRLKFICILLFALCSSLFAQRKETLVTLHHADSLIGKTLNGESVRELIGNVKLSQENVIVTCDKATEFLAKKYFLLEGNVKVKEDSLVFFGKRGTYSSETKIAEGFDGVRLEEGKKNLVATKGKYFSDERKAFFEGNVIANDTDVTLSANEVTYYRNDKHLFAIGNVILSNKSNSVKSYGERFENFPETKFSRLTGNPKVIEFDTTGDKTIDTLIVTADTIESLQDSLEHLWAKKNVEIVRDSVSATSGFLEYVHAKDSIMLLEKPFVFYGEHQVRGDSIVLLLEKKGLRKAFIKNRAMAISKADSSEQNRFNQLSGERMELFFEEKKLQRINVQRSATSLYFLFDDDSVSGKKKPNGINKASGDEVKISFDNSKIEKIVVVGGVEGQYFPENLIKGKEEEFRLDGFQWIERKKVDSKEKSVGRK